LLDPAIASGGRSAQEFLDRMRRLQDEPADRLATEIFEAPDSRAVGESIRELIRERRFYTPDGRPAPRLPAVVRRYLQETSALPSWADRRKIEMAEELFVLYGLSSVIVLSCASLPECYVLRSTARVLSSTGYLGTDPARRVAETARLIMDVMSPGGLMPATGVGNGVLSAQKVRLMHAAIRYLISRGRTKLEWDSARWGLPICQEDLAYTLMTFSYVGVRGMKDLGIVLSAEQQDAYIHCWNVIGHVMGILPELLPADVAEAKLLFETIKARQTGPNDEGVRLTGALVDDLLVPVLSRIIPVVGRDAPLFLIRTLIGDATADDLGVAKVSGRARLHGTLGIRLWRRGAMRRYFLYRFWLTRRLALRLKLRAFRDIGGVKEDFAISLANAVWAFPSVAEAVDRAAE